MIEINPIEIELKYNNGHIEEDFIAKRIALLVKGYLVKMKTNNSGWNTLYVDPADNRLWELSYPNSELNGSGDPCLTYIKKEDASSKYNIQK